MNNNKTTNILLGILIVVLIAIGVIMAINQNRNSYRNGMTANDFPVIDNRNNIPEPVKTNPSQQVSSTSTPRISNWNSFPGDEVWALLDENKLVFERDSGVKISQQVDLTGDGISEAIVEGNGGNNGFATILIANSNGVEVAKVKNKNGIISPVYVYSVGRVAVNESYKFIPNENGFYTVSKTLDERADNSDSSHFMCATGAVSAYQWNPKTNLFEYNSALTAKYTASECK